MVYNNTYINGVIIINVFKMEPGGRWVWLFGYGRVRICQEDSPL